MANGWPRRARPKADRFVSLRSLNDRCHRTLSEERSDETKRRREPKIGSATGAGVDHGLGVAVETVGGVHHPRCIGQLVATHDDRDADL